MNVFEFRQDFFNEYAEFTRSFTRIKADDIRSFVDGEYASQKYWPEPLVQVNPIVQSGGTVESLCEAGPRPPEQRYTPRPSFPWRAERRAQLRAELDAHFALVYGMTRDELRYILDPDEVLGPDYPSETFKVVRKYDMREFSEYCTQRLMLAVWDEVDKTTGVSP